MAQNFEWLFCPTCQRCRRFEYKVHLDDWAGECGHRLTDKEIREQRELGQDCAEMNHDMDR